LSTPNIIPKTVFCGREDVLSEIHAKYLEGDRVLFLYGIGGIGKTQIAKQYAKQHRKDYDTIVYATYNGNLKKLIIDEAPFTFEPAMSRYTMSDGTQENDDLFFARKLDAIQKLASERLLIIIDNFDVEEDEHLPLLTNGRYHLLITSRCDYSRYYPTIAINPIESMDTLKDIFMRNYQGDDVETDDPALIELIELVNRHTYTVELLAQHMENSGQTPEEMIAALKEEGITSLNEEVRNADMKTQIAYENLLKMFRLFSLSDEERQILMYLSLMPLDGINVRDFKDWAGIKSSKLIKHLENRSWITRNTEGIALHPIIRAVIKHEIPPTEDTCRDFIARFTDTIQDSKAWLFKKSDKDKYATIAKELLAAFPMITPNTEGLYYHSEGLMSFAVDPAYAVVLAKHLYDYYSATCSAQSYEVGRSAYKIGWAYAYNSQLPNSLEQALKWLGQADQILSNIELTTSEQAASLSQTRVNLAKTHLTMFEQTQSQHDYLLAKEYAAYNVKYSLKSYQPGDPQYVKLAGAYWQLANVLLAGGEYDQALANIENSLGILIPLRTENDSDSMYALSRKAAILHAMGRYSEAKPIAQKAAIGYSEFFGETHPIIVRMYVLLGDCFYSLGEKEDANIIYEKALEIAKILYAPNAQQITELQAKLL